MWLKQSTSVDVPIGPFLDSTDGNTAETALSITQPDIRLKKNGGAWAQKNAAQTLAHEENGLYEVTLDGTDTGTLGLLRVHVHKSGALPAWRDFVVLPPAVYDAMVAGAESFTTSVGYGPYLRKYNTLLVAGTTAIRVAIPKIAAGGAALSANWTPAAGDVKISIDGAAEGNVTNLPVFDDGAWSFILTAAELSGKNITVRVSDAAPKAVADIFFSIETYGNASAMSPDDLSAASGVAQTGDSYARIGANGSALTGVPWNAAWDAEVQSEVQDAVEANHLDHLLAVDYDPTAKPGVATALLNEMVESNAGVSRLTAGALAQAAGAVTTALNTYDPPTHAEVTAAVAAGDDATLAAIATLQTFVDTEVAAILAAVDTEVAAIKSKTDNLPASPAAVGDIPTANAIRDAVFLRAFSAAYNSYTFDELVKLFASVLLGKASGQGTATGTHRNLADTADVVVTNHDADGNRTAVIKTP